MGEITSAALKNDEGEKTEKFLMVNKALTKLRLLGHTSP